MKTDERESRIEAILLALQTTPGLYRDTLFALICYYDAVIDRETRSFLLKTAADAFSGVEKHGLDFFEMANKSLSNMNAKGGEA